MITVRGDGSVYVHVNTCISAYHIETCELNIYIYNLFLCLHMPLETYV